MNRMALSAGEKLGPYEILAAIVYEFAGPGVRPSKPDD
jgi:hypothetical protein